MNSRVLLAALAGAVTSFLGGWLVYGILLDSMLRGMVTPEAAATAKEPPVLWAIFASQLVWCFLLAWIFDRWAKISTLKTGAIGGAIVGFLGALSFDLGVYAMWNMFSPNILFVDPVASAVLGLVAGGTVGWVLGYKRA